jgi:hypothetical protein
MKKMYDLMKQARKIQSQLQKTKEELAAREVDATSGGGVVRAVVNGNRQLLRLEIDREVVDPDDVDMLQDLVVSAVNLAMENADRLAGEEISKVTGGMPIPGLF